MADENTAKNPFHAFADLDLEAMVAAPLVAAVRAQAVAARTSLEILTSLMKQGAESQVFEPAEFQLQLPEDPSSGTPARLVKVPLVSLINLPQLRIDKLNVAMGFELSSTTRSEASTELEGEGGAGLGKFLSIKGRATTRNSASEALNASASIDIKLEATSTDPPEGLARLLDLLGQVHIVREPKT